MPIIDIDGALLECARDNAGATYADIAVALGAAIAADINKIERRLRRAIRENKGDRDFIRAVCVVLGADFNLIRQDVFMAWIPPAYLDMRPRVSPLEKDDWRDSPTMATLSTLRFETRQSGRIDAVRLRLPHCASDYEWLYATNIAPGPNGWLGACRQITPPIMLRAGDIWSEEVMFATGRAPRWRETLAWLSQADDPEISVIISNSHGVMLERRFTPDLSGFHEKAAHWAKSDFGVYPRITLRLEPSLGLTQRSERKTG